MGYRSRLGKICKAERDKYKNKTYEEAQQIVGEDNSLYYPPEHKELYEIGKYADYNKGLEAFYNFDIYKMCESEFHIMTKENLLEIIRDYHKKIYQGYKELEEGKDSSEFIKSRVREWGRNGFDIQPYYLDQKKTDGEIVRSWQYEYAIFNLVYIYRTFDWENDYLIYSAW